MAESRPYSTHSNDLSHDVAAADPEDGTSTFPPSIFVETGLVPVAFVIYGVVMRGLLLGMFVATDSKKPVALRIFPDILAPSGQWSTSAP